MLLKNPMGQWWNWIMNQKISQDKWKYNFTKSTQYGKSSSKTGVHNDIGLLQEIRKTSNNLTYYLKEWEKEQPKPTVKKKKKAKNKAQRGIRV